MPEIYIKLYYKMRNLQKLNYNEMYIAGHMQFHEASFLRDIFQKSVVFKLQKVPDTPYCLKRYLVEIVSGHFVANDNRQTSLLLSCGLICCPFCVKSTVLWNHAVGHHNANYTDV